MTDFAKGPKAKAELDMPKESVTCLYSPTDNRNLFVVGYSNGNLEIRDVKTLKKVFFQHKFTQGQINKAILNVDLYWHLVVVHEYNGVTSTILKKVDPGLIKEKNNFIRSSTMVSKSEAILSPVMKDQSHNGHELVIHRGPE